MGEVKVADFLDKVDMRKNWMYDGSLTTPPCTEGVKWIIIDQVQTIKVEQLVDINRYFRNNMSFAGKWLGNNRAI